MNIGKQIRMYRLQKKVKQEELASYLGVSAQAVSKWETGRSAPDVSMLLRKTVCQILHYCQELRPILEYQ